MSTSVSEKLRAMEKEMREYANEPVGLPRTPVDALIDGWADRLTPLIAELGQEVGAVPNGKLVGWWNGITPGFDGMGVPSIRWGADAENSGHDIPLYDGYNPIHYVTPPFSPAHTSSSTSRRTQPMSSEMRELVILALQSAYAHGEKHAPFALHDCARQIVDAALLARTEAGADDWPFVEEIGRDGKPTGYWIRKGTPAAARNTHPQDASGDAEVLTAHGIKALDRCCEELRYWIGLADDMNFDEMTVSAFETAIESMEMRKANAMQAKESK